MVAPPSTPGGMAEMVRTDLGAQRQAIAASAGNPVGGRRVDAGRGHHADVLGIGGGRRTAAEPGQHGGHAVGGQRAAVSGSVSVPVIWPDRLHVPDVLGDQRDHRGQEHRQHRQTERRGLELRQPDQPARRDRRGVHLAERQRQQVARRTTARKIASRPRMPRKNASTPTSSTSVTTPTSGPFSKFVLAAGARLNPISATIAPVTIGGRITLDPAGADQVHRPHRSGSAAHRPPPTRRAHCRRRCEATAAVTGAITEKLEPR